MFKRIIIALAIVAVIAVNPAVAGNNKTEPASGINPAGQTQASQNGAAWWKADLNSCVETSAAIETENDSLIKQLQMVIAERDALQAQLDGMQLKAAAEPSGSYVAEARKFAVYKMAANHPNTPNAYGVYTNFFIDNSQAQGLIENMQSGFYDVVVMVTDPDGVVTKIETSLQADVKPRAYYDHYVELTLP